VWGKIDKTSIIISLIFRCRAVNRYAKDFAHDNCCLANTTALELYSHLRDEDVIYISYQNKVYMYVRNISW